MADDQKPAGPVRSGEVSKPDPKPKTIRRPPADKMLGANRIIPGYQTKG